MLIGALFVQFIPVYGPDWLRSLLEPLGVDIEDTTPGVPAVLYGTILLAVLLVARSGVAGLVQRAAYPLANRFNTRRLQRHVTPSRREA
jgi:ABC-type branched-subunit amino acid transport system permease subunit